MDLCFNPKIQKVENLKLMEMLIISIKLLMTWEIIKRRKTIY